MEAVIGVSAPSPALIPLIMVSTFLELINKLACAQQRRRPDKGYYMKICEKI